MNQGFQRLIRLLNRAPTACWIVLLCVPALLPLFQSGFFESHDGLQHAYRLAALDRAVRAGALYPRWFGELAFGYGHPVLNFYGPLSYYWGLPFTLLGAEATTALKLVFALSLVASALAMYAFARLHLARGPALVAATVYVYVPYHLVDLYVRGALAEFMALVWLPVVLYAFHRLIDGADQPILPRLGLASASLTALILTHNLSVLIFAPVLACYAILLLVQRRNLGTIAQRFRGSRLYAASIVALALVLTLALSSCYLLPVLAESRYVGLAYTVSQGYRNHLLRIADLIADSPVYRYAQATDAPPSFPVGQFEVVVCAGALILLFVRHQRRWPTIFFLVVAAVSIFMLSTISLPAWQAMEGVLAYLQYPWRFEVLTVLSVAFLAGTAVGAFGGSTSPPSPLLRQGKEEGARPRRRGGVQAALAAVCIVLGAGAAALWRLPVLPASVDLSVEAMWAKEREAGQVGTTWTGEYLPIWVTEQRWAISHPVASAGAGSAAEPSRADVKLKAGQFRLIGTGYNRFDWLVNTTDRTTLVLHQFHYPGWQARWQGKVIPSRPEGVLGLAAFDLPPGSGPLIVSLGLTPYQRGGMLVSALALLGLALALAARSLRPARHRPPAVVTGGHPYGGLREARGAWRSLVPALCCLIPCVVLLFGLFLPNGFARAVREANANLEDRAQLAAFSTDHETYQAGDTVTVTLYWLALRNLEEETKAFVHLTDAAMTQQPAQHDGEPGGGFTPVTRWIPGELLPDVHTLVLPTTLTAGRYRLWAGMYVYPSVRNMAVLSADLPSADNRVLLGEIEVVAP